MRYRDYKIFQAGCYYHVYNRGNNKQIIFIDENDYFQFLKRLKLVLGITKDPSLNLRAVPPGSFSIIAFCLMPNHFHFLIRQEGETGIEKLIAKACTSYAAYFNKKYERTGHVFQDAFKAKLVDTDEYAKYLSAYIHNNPQEIFVYPYSSLQDILGTRNGQICNKEIILGWFENDPNKYKNFVLKSNNSLEKINHLLFEE